MSTPGKFETGGPPPRGGGSRVLITILIVVGVLLVACAGLCGGCIFVAQRAAKEAQRAAKEVGEEVGAAIELMPVMTSVQTAVAEDDQVKQRLGEPVQITSTPERGNTGELDPVHESFTFGISGPNGTADVTGHATKVDGAWKVTQIEVVPAEGEKFEVPPPEGAPLELNFDINP